MFFIGHFNCSCAHGVVKLSFDTVEKSNIGCKTLVALQCLCVAVNASLKHLCVGENKLKICAELEAQIAELPADEKEMFLSELGIKQAGLDTLIQKSYDLLGLMSYLTAGKPEVRAWTIKKGTKAPQAAGKIHSDFERGFIRAEVISFDDLMANGSMAAAKEKGLVRSEGKEYVMQDGDIVLFRFNV